MPKISMYWRVDFNLEFNGVNWFGNERFRNRNGSLSNKILDSKRVDGQKNGSKPTSRNIVGKIGYISEN